MLDSLFLLSFASFFFFSENMAVCVLRIVCIVCLHYVDLSICLGMMYCRCTCGAFTMANLIVYFQSYIWFCVFWVVLLVLNCSFVMHVFSVYSCGKLMPALTTKELHFSFCCYSLLLAILAPYLIWILMEVGSFSTPLGSLSSVVDFAISSLFLLFSLEL